MSLEEPITELSQTSLERFPFSLRELGNLALQGKKGQVTFPLMVSGNELWQILQRTIGEGSDQISREDLNRSKVQAMFSASETCPARLVGVESLPLEKSDKDKYQLGVAIDAYNAQRTKGTRHIFLTDRENRIYTLFPPLHFTQGQNGVIDWDTIINEKNAKVNPLKSLKIEETGRQVDYFGSLNLNLTSGSASFVITNYKI